KHPWRAGLRPCLLPEFALAVGQHRRRLRITSLATGSQKAPLPTTARQIRGLGVRGLCCICLGLSAGLSGIRSLDNRRAATTATATKHFADGFRYAAHIRPLRADRPAP